MPGIEQDGWRLSALVAGGIGALVIAVALAVLTRSFRPAPARDTSEPETEPDDGEPADEIHAALTPGPAPAPGAVGAAAVIGVICAALVALAHVQGQVPAESEAAVVGAPVDAPTQVSIELTAAGRRKAARAMGCTPGRLADEGILNGWVVGGDFRSPSVVVFTPNDTCVNGRVDLEPGDGFVYPGLFFPEEATTTTTTTAPPAPVPTSSPFPPG